MNKKKIIKYQKENVAALFKITANCNDDCNFCIERKYTKKGLKDLSLKEIKDNFNYLRNNFNLDYVIITGGEPTIHKNFFKILDYFYKEKIEFRIITNLLHFNNKSFLEKTLNYFPSDRNNKIIGSINNLPISEIEIKRMSGLENFLKYKLPIMLILVINKNNLESLSDLIIYLHKLFKKYDYKKINIEFRLIYIGDTLKSLLKKSLPTDFKKIKEYIQKAVKTANLLGVNIIFWNFPLCYIDNLPRFQDSAIEKRRQRRLLKVSKDFQLKKIQIRDFKECFIKNDDCVNCEYNNCCSGIENDYLDKYNFPLLKVKK
ncbi:radical SAM protein [Patescibacteria group bacterium]|nr:radical SAM protein [Patescibacteria group bacterium]